MTNGKMKKRVAILLPVTCLAWYSLEWKLKCGWFVVWKRLIFLIWEMAAKLITNSVGYLDNMKTFKHCRSQRKQRSAAWWLTAALRNTTLSRWWTGWRYNVWIRCTCPDNVIYKYSNKPLFNACLLDQDFFRVHQIRFKTLKDIFNTK